MEQQTLDFLSNCGLEIKRNGREYLATMANFPEIQVVFQRQEDIVKGVANGMLSLGITGYDLTQEIPLNDEEILILHQKLGFGNCNLEVVIPENWNIYEISELVNGTKFRVASKFPRLTARFFEKEKISYTLVDGAGTLEVSPALGNADLIVDLVSTGRTLEDNRLKRIRNGTILTSQACFFVNGQAILNEEIFKIARQLLEYFEATIRADQYVNIFANLRGDPAIVLKSDKMTDGLEGLQGATISPIFRDDPWFAMHIVVEKTKLPRIIRAIRQIGGSGIVVTQLRYIFEEEPPQCKTLLQEVQRRKGL